jgi:lipopolysaccharide export system permease protein
MGALSSWLRASTDALNSGARWVLTSRKPALWGVLVCVGILFALQAVDYHESFVPWMPIRGEELPPGYRIPTEWTLFYYYVAPYLKVMGLLGGILFHLSLIRSVRDVSQLIVPVWLSCGFITLWILMAEMHAQWLEVYEVSVGQPFSLWAYVGKLVAITFLLLSPAIILTYYQTRYTWERYVLKSMLRPLLLSILAFCALYVVWDLKDRFDDFREAKVPNSRMAAFYINMIPFVFVEVCAPCLVLATLLTLYQMGRRNETISLMGAGLSTARLLRPIFIVAGYFSALAMAANFHWAQRAEAEREAILHGNDLKSVLLSGVLYYNAEARRQWFIREVPYNLRDNKMKRVQVREFDEHGQVIRTLAAATAYWWPEELNSAPYWSFYRGVDTTYQDGVLVKSEPFNADETGKQRVDVHTWTETPWDVIANSLNPNHMGVPELSAFLRSRGPIAAENVRREFQTQLWHRLAHPWQGFAIVLAIAPLALQTSRRQSMRAAATGFILFFINLFLNVFSINLGRAGLLPAALVVWLPHLAAAELGVVMLALQHGAPPLPDRFWGAETRGWLRDVWRQLRGRRTSRLEASPSSQIRRMEIRQLLDVE